MNFIFQLSIEILNYLDAIIALQVAIFNSMSLFGISSMTPLLLRPLIPCIHDSNQLYDFSVHLIFLLHANLREELLLEHRNRFTTMFNQLHIFYKKVEQSQCFTKMIEVPELPVVQPNFLPVHENINIENENFECYAPTAPTLDML